MKKAGRLPVWHRLLSRGQLWRLGIDPYSVKALGSEIARRRYEARIAGPDVTRPGCPVAIGLGGGLCRQADIESAWLHHWCGRMGMAAIYHRKVWEDCFVLQALWEGGMIAPGRRGLGFAVGVEAIPALLASESVQVLATDLDQGRREAEVWRETGQHGGSRDQLYHPHLVDRDAFEARVEHRAADMNRIPGDLHGGFDFCWSVCALEHLGSIELGLRFVENAMRCLKPGGLAVHTLEFNLDPRRCGRQRRGPTSLFEESDIAALAGRLARLGHRMSPVSFDPGDGVLDRFVDVPPYADDVGGRPLRLGAPHLRAHYRQFAVTSLGIIVRAAD